MEALKGYVVVNLTAEMGVISLEENDSRSQPQNCRIKDCVDVDIDYVVIS